MKSSSPHLDTFLVVDDEPDILDAVARLFRNKYRVLTAHSVDEAWELVRGESIDVVLADQRMPSGTGLEFFSQLKSTHPDTVRVLFTGYTNLDHVIDAINHGDVYRYITKPWQPAELRLFIAQAFEHRRTQIQLKALVEQLRQSNEHLEAKNQALSQANEDLTMLDRMKTVFMEVVSHELNTPLAVILGYTALLKKGRHLDDPDLLEKALSRIESSANRLKHINNRIWKTVTSEDPKTALSLQNIELNPFLDHLISQLAPFLEKRRQSIKVEVDQRSATVIADPDKLSDILVNLLMNAIKFSKDGEQITIDVRQSDEDPDELHVVISDRGIGISEDDVSQIFSAFFSSFKSAHHSSGQFEFGKRGIGLGLTIAQRFAEMHGGRIEVESREGQGSTFTLILPKEPRATKPKRSLNATS